jgi:hypothetical protein
MKGTDEKDRFLRLTSVGTDFASVSMEILEGDGNSLKTRFVIKTPMQDMDLPDNTRVDEISFIVTGSIESTDLLECFERLNRNG